MDKASPEVLVIGGRTTGLMMASELARHDVRVRIVDKSPEIDPHVRANIFHSRTLEIFESLGLADQALEGSFPEHGVRIFVNGKLAGETRHEEIDSQFPFGMSQSQAHTEATLERHLNGFDVQVERSVTLTAMTQHADRVVATLQHADGRDEVVEAPWLIGCDGAHSTVRHLTGCAFPGDADPFPYVLADVSIEGELVHDEGYFFLHDDGDLFIFSMLPERRRLVCANLPAGQDRDDPPTLEEMQELVDTRGIPGLKLTDPRWLTHFRIHYRLAPHYRHGRTFLAGDSAHIHSLLAGQGMNTGIQDAFNLAWKLALVIRGVVPETWLDSYEVERRRVGEDVVTMTREVTERAELFASISEEEREKLVAHMFVPQSERLKVAKHLQEVDLDYRTSPLCIEEPGGFEGGPHAGSPVPDAAPINVDGNEHSLFALPQGTKHRLVLFAGAETLPPYDELVRAATAAHDTHGHWIEVLLVAPVGEPGCDVPPSITLITDTTRTMHERYAATEPCLYLFRPDGYVAFRSTQLESLRDYLAHVL